MAKASDNLFPKVKLGLAGTVPSAPSDSSWTLYSMANGVFARSSNTTVGPFGTGGGGGAVATDTIWDAAGDLAVGSGADTATKLTLGASGKAPFSNGSTLAYAYPPGYEFDYTEVTSSVTISATTEGTANNVVTSGSVAYDGSTVVFIEFFCPRVNTSTTSASSIVLLLYEDSTLLGRLGLVKTVAAASDITPVLLKRRRTPSNASHTYSIKAYSTSGTTSSQLDAGTGGTGVELPLYIRITKA